MKDKFRAVVFPTCNLVIVLTLLLALTLPVAGQDTAQTAPQFSVGIKVGRQVTDALTADPRLVRPSALFDHFTLGPEVTVTLPHRLGVEFDALHAHYAYGVLLIDQLHGVEGFINTHIAYWNFPLLLSWRPVQHGIANVSPFLASGLSIRHTTANGLDAVIFNPNSIYNRPVGSAAISNTWTTGPVVSGGLEFKFPYFRVVPEVRYTHWAKRAIEEPNLFETGPGVAWGANTNQLELLLGVNIGTR